MLKAVIELIGPAGAGKTTLATLLAQTLSPASVLIIDACADQQTSKALCDTPPKRSLTTLVQELLDKAYQTPTPSKQAMQEAVDWAFNDLPTSVQSDKTNALAQNVTIDLMTVGLLTENLPDNIIKLFTYGLTRLMESHDVVVIDGYHSVIHQLLPQDLLSVLVVCQPNENNPLPTGFESMKTPYVIISNDTGSELSANLTNSFENGALRLIGKLPVFGGNEAMQAQLPQLFENCILRMNLPLQPKSHSA